MCIIKLVQWLWYTGMGRLLLYSPIAAGNKYRYLFSGMFLLAHFFTGCWFTGYIFLLVFYLCQLAYTCSVGFLLQLQFNWPWVLLMVISKAVHLLLRLHH